MKQREEEGKWDFRSGEILLGEGRERGGDVERYVDGSGKGE